MANPLAAMLAAALSWLVAVGAAPASAQPSDADREEARALFAAGQAAVDAGRWTDALDAFDRAYELTNAPSALFNAAFALRALGRYREAERRFVELLALEATRPDMRTEAQGYLDEVRGRIARLRLDGLPDDVTPSIRLDGEAVLDDGMRPLVVAADPGHHLLDVTAAGRERFEWAGDLGDGETLDLAVRLPSTDVADADEVTPGGSGSVVEEAWFWVVIGVVVLGAAGGIVGGVIGDQEAQLRPESSMVVRLP